MFGTADLPVAGLDGHEHARLDALRRRVDPNRLRRLVEALPGPRNRFGHAAAMQEAEHRVAEGLSAGDWNVSRRRFRTLGADGVNVIAESDVTRRAPCVAVVAHYDTVDTSPGADDNGAGVAALLVLAQLLAGRTFARPVVLAAVDMEEAGFLGSQAFVQDRLARGGVAAAFVLECVGFASAAPGSQRIPAGFGALYRDQVRRIRSRQNRGDFHALVFRGDARQHAAAVARPLAALRGRGGVALVRDPSDLPAVGWAVRTMAPGLGNLHRSDHVPFWQAGLPCVQVTDTADFRNPNYHAPSDTPDTLDYGFVADLVAALAFAVPTMAGADA